VTALRRPRSGDAWGGSRQPTMPVLVIQKFASFSLRALQAYARGEFQLRLGKTTYR